MSNTCFLSNLSKTYCQKNCLSYFSIAASNAISVLSLIMVN